MWRRVLAGTGRTLIGLGVLLLLFIAYQLWGTNLAEAHNQHSLAQQFKIEKTQAQTAPAAAPSAPVLPGYAIAVITIPKVHLQKYVVQGTTDDDLQKGPGHYDGTPLPGQSGNMAIAGHRTTYGAPFYNLDQMARGDQILLDTPAGGHFVYSVITQKVVDPNDVSVVTPKPPGLTPDGPHPDYLLTLTTCTPRFSAAQRLVIWAQLTSAPAPPGNPGGAAPTTPAVLPSGGEGTGPQAASAAPAPTNLTSGSSSGIPGTVGWGLGATALAVAAWLGSHWWRRRRGRGRGMLAYLVGVAPFLVLLYFFFENVTRLLPPSV